MLKNWQLPGKWKGLGGRLAAEAWSQVQGKTEKGHMRIRVTLADRVVMCYSTELVLGANKMAQKFPVRDHWGAARKAGVLFSLTYR